MARFKRHLISGAAGLALSIGGALSAQADDTQNYQIPAGSLQRALDSYISQSGRDLIYRSDEVRGLTANRLSGQYSDMEALNTLLDGSNLIAHSDETGALLVMAELPSTMPVIMAQSQAVQNTPAPVVSMSEEDIVEEARQDTIVVVGSQIVGAQSGGNLPVTVVGEDEVAAIGGVDGDDLFRAIPQMGDVGFNSTENVSGGVNSARGDVASINLRALGTGNTLTLLNGRRMVNHPGTQSENLVPVVTVNANTIPVTGVSRVEVLLDGASALYGTDAVAGVVNTVLKDDFEGFTMSMRYGLEPEAGGEELTVSFEAGQNFNNDRSNIAVFGSYTTRDPVYASDRDWAANADLRDRLPASWEGDTQFRGTSTNTPWGAFTLRDPVTGDTVGVTDVTSSGGAFHVQPDTESGCLVDLGDGICIDDGNSTSNIPLRYNTNSARTINNGVDRLNLFGTLHHDFENGVTLFGEAGYYHADSYAERAGSANLTADRTIIPASNYWNPFGAVGSPNRIEGIGTPAEGYDVELRRYRVVDAGPRVITVENEVYRLLAGLEGDWNGFDWETALVYSEARTNDTTTRISNTLFYEALALDTPDAYNPFNGGGLPLSDEGDGTPSSAVGIESFLVPVYRISETSLAMWDFKVSRPDLFEIWAGPVGAAAGLELRRESYLDDRDPRLDGTIEFLSPLTGELTSDVMGSSQTLDSEGDRNVASAFIEFAVPLVSEDMNIPLVQSVDLQLAGRFEDYDLFGSVAKPKVALSWRMTDYLMFRSAWSEGFKAPNLQQQYNRALERVNTRTDYSLCAVDLANGTIADFSDCDQSSSVVSQRQGSTELTPEESENFTLGFVFDSTFLPPEYGDLQLTVDYWSIEQEDVVGIFGDGNHLVLDYLRRVQGSSNPAVVREAGTTDGLTNVGEILYVEDNYTNFLPRTVEGVDLGVYYDLDDTPFGDFSLRVNVAHLLTFDQAISPVEAEILEAQESGLISSVASLSGVGDLVRQDGRPEWRWSGSATWRNGPYGAGWYTGFVDDVNDTSATNDDTGEFWTVDSHMTHSAYVQYTFDEDTDSPTRIRVGARNIFDEDPPLADESFGYMGSLHSSRGRFVYLSARKEF
ncbi:TonB-dependent receptor [Ponticaulis sp.]|uniref:TonB-dependent receptor n=1 Tax=Ponticaulis sp. TaxID=2020902 RepID=UPI000B6770BD|nr:TonB-dependent receptor [Ponticaulis sp.]MAI91985.1 TonB-dependent receptor [Ponticaulis sp.]OUX96454.1 MAG: hypothetical protein CBB65_16260 [Hyphomonadaceae bacterium TMED5]|tara:strand:- start:63686 stop:67000 length:3315 start_codon:yes stop_codon:yes gene_type:complete